MLTKDQQIINQDCFLIKSNKRKIHPGAESVHKISTDLCDLFGVPESFLCVLFDRYLSKADILVAHNLAFDLKMIDILFARNHFDIDLNIKQFCTMKASTNLCKLPGRYGNYKWPKLSELYRFLFNEDFENVHDALADVKATMRCYFEMPREVVRIQNTK